MLERTIYLAGPGGTGKTRIISNLLSEFSNTLPGNPDKLDRKSYNRTQKWEGYEEDTYNYAIGKIIHRHIKEAKIHEELEQENPDKVILADRCLVDAFAYSLAAERFGDLKKWQSFSIRSYAWSFPNKLMPRKIIFLDYPLSYIKENLENRWKREQKGFREDNEEYLRTVSKAFQDYFQMLPPMLTLNNPETGLEQIKEFLKKNFKLEEVHHQKQ